MTTTKYMGCYNIIENNYSFNEGFLYSVDMTIEICKRFCVKHSYFLASKRVTWSNIGLSIVTMV